MTILKLSLTVSMVALFSTIAKADTLKWNCLPEAGKGGADSIEIEVVTKGARPIVSVLEVHLQTISQGYPGAAQVFVPGKIEVVEPDQLALGGRSYDNSFYYLLSMSAADGLAPSATLKEWNVNKHEYDYTCSRTDK
jgi:hypothetical protein